MKFGKVLAIVIVGMFIAGGFAVVSMGGDDNNNVTPAALPPQQTNVWTKVNKVSLCQDYTGWTCPPCHTYKPFLDGAINTYTGGYLVNVAPSMQHVYWPAPYYTDPVWMYQKVKHNASFMYYGLNSVPDTYVSGVKRGSTGTVAGVQAWFDTDRAAMSSIILTTSGYLNTATGAGYINVHAECVAPLAVTDQRLMINLWENNITRTLNGDAPPYPNLDTDMTWAVWDIIPDASGTPVSLKKPGEYYDAVFNFNCPAGVVMNNMGITVYVQDYPTKAVDQAYAELFQKPYIKLLSPSPNSLNQLYNGPISVNWNAIDTQSTVTINLDYSTNNGTSWTNIATGIANTPPYSWTPTGIDSAYVKLRVTSVDTQGRTNSDISREYFSVDMVANNRWYLQTQANFVAGKKDLDMKPMERSAYNFWDLALNPPQTTATATAPSDVVVQTYASGYQAPSTMDVAGPWTFNIWGKANLSAPLPTGNFFARVYATDGVTPRLLFTTAYDDENIGAFTDFHAFNWAFTAPSATMNAGERIQVEIVAHMTAAVANSKSDWQIRSEYTYNNTGTKTGTYANLALQDASNEVLTEVLINPNPMLVYQNFTSTTFPPTGWAQSGTVTNPTIWSRRVSSNAAGSSPAEARLMYVNENSAAGWRLYCGPINTVGMTSLTVTWKELIDSYSNGYTLRVQSANVAPAGPWTSSTWSYAPGTTAIVVGPRTSTATITSNLNNANTYICWYLTGNCYNINYWYVDDIVVQQTASTSAVEQRYSVSAPLGETTYVFSAYGSRPTTADADNFALEYSVNGGTAWTTMATINSASNAWYNYTFPAPPGVPTFLLRVRDTVRTAGATTLSSVTLDKMYIYTLAGNKITVGYDTYGQASYIDPTLNPGGSTALPWQNITVVAGWNLVSVNLTGPTTMPTALTDKVNGGAGLVVWSRAMWYNPLTTADPWKQYNTGWNAGLNDLTTVSNAIGVWLYVTTVGDGQICIGGTGYSLPTTTAVSLRTGWNLVGFPSNDAAYTVAMLKAACPTVSVVEQYNGAQTYLTLAMADADVFAPDKAYWVYTSADTVWNKAY
jgi:hypothetical protein